MLQVVKQTITYDGFKYDCPHCGAAMKPVKNKGQAGYLLETHLRMHLRNGEISETELKKLLSSTLE